MSTHQRILILFAHPTLHRSEANRPLYNASAAIENVTLTDLYREYPTGQIDIDREQKRLQEHDVIVFMFPLYWYSTPALLKEWQDLVLEHGFAYGHQATALKGKLFFCAVTAGGPEDAYHTDGYNQFTLRELLYPLEQMSTLTGMHYLPPYALFSARTAADDGRLQQHVAQWQVFLADLATGRVNLEQIRQSTTINDYLSSSARQQI